MKEHLSSSSNTVQHELFPEEGAEYELLVGHDRTDGSFKSTEQLQTEYIELTDELVRQMTEGVAVVDPQTGERVVRRPDVVIWLDKSARPVEWLTRNLWDTLAADSETGEVPPMPKSRFVNIDREQWVNTVDPSGTGKMEIDLVDQSVVRSLRSIFVEPKYKQVLDETIEAAPAELDGKTILIIDEVKSSGRTLDIAKKFFERAFPTTAVATSHWMKGIVTVGDRRSGEAQGNADLPVWYKEDSAFGRGVGNRDERQSQLSPSRTQRLGGWFLSTALPKQEVTRETSAGEKQTGKVIDPISTRLRVELRQLAEDAHDGRVLVVPSMMRDSDDYDRRVEKLNHGMTMEEYIQKKRALARGDTSN